MLERVSTERVPRDRLVTLLQLGPAVAFLAVTFLVPLLMTFGWSFWPRTDNWMRPGFTLAAYEQLFTGSLQDVFVRSVKATAIVLAVAIPLGYPAAYYLSRKVSDAVAFPLLFVFTVPFIISNIIRVFSIRAVLGTNGPINRALTGLGLIDEPLRWLLFSNVSVYIGLGITAVPFVIFPIYMSIDSIDESIVEATRDLGGSSFDVFKDVVLPLSMPGVFAATIFVAVTTIGATTVPELLSDDGFPMFGASITEVLSSLNFPLASALASLSVVTMLLLLVLWERFFDLNRLMEFTG